MYYIHGVGGSSHSDLKKGVAHENLQFQKMGINVLPKKIVGTFNFIFLFI